MEREETLGVDARSRDDITDSNNAVVAEEVEEDEEEEIYTINLNPFLSSVFLWFCEMIRCLVFVPLDEPTLWVLTFAFLLCHHLQAILDQQQQATTAAANIMGGDNNDSGSTPSWHELHIPPWVQHGWPLLATLTSSLTCMAAALPQLLMTNEEHRNHGGRRGHGSPGNRALSSIEESETTTSSSPVLSSASSSTSTSMGAREDEDELTVLSSFLVLFVLETCLPPLILGCLSSFLVLEKVGVVTCIILFSTIWAGVTLTAFWFRRQWAYNWVAET